MSPAPPQLPESAIAQVGAWLRAMPMRAVLQLLSRIGYVARGAVYLSIGAIACLAVLDVVPTASGAVGAMQAWGRWPAGVMLIWLAGAGLMAFAGWRVLQAVFDADAHGVSPRAWAVRGGQAISGVAHGALAFSAFQLLDELGDLNEEGEAREAAAALLEFPGGDWALIAAGFFILGVGVGNVLQGLFYDFSRRLGCSPQTCRWAVPLGRIGYLGRGVAFAPLGFFIAKAGFEARSSQVHSLGGALQTLDRQPLGSWVLTLTALGLIAFGLFALVEARYRRMSVPRELEL